MKWNIGCPAKDKPILIKCYEPTELGYYYYVVKYNNEMSSLNYEATYTEYLGEEHAYWVEDEIIAWADFDSLDEDFKNYLTISKEQAEKVKIKQSTEKCYLEQVKEAGIQRPTEKCYLFHFNDDSLYEMTCGINFKDALWEMSKYTGQSSELLCKCLKSFDGDDVEGIIELFHHFAIKTIEDVYIVDKKIYG